MAFQLHDLTGQQFGRLRAVSISHRTRQGKTYWLCDCECGAQRVVRSDALHDGSATCCKACLKIIDHDANLKSRLLSRIATSKSGCWEWQNSCTSYGYGILHVRGKPLMAHIASYGMFVGDVGGQCVLHKCDNPKCINPEHLFLGNQADNNADKCRKGRQAWGSMIAQSKLSQEDVEQIRSMYIPRVVSLRQVANKFGISRQAVSQIINGQTWSRFGLAQENSKT